jgi:hypothetical protein
MGAGYAGGDGTLLDPVGVEVVPGIVRILRP